MDLFRRILLSYFGSIEACFCPFVPSLILTRAGYARQMMKIPGNIPLRISSEINPKQPSKNRAARSALQHGRQLLLNQLISIRKSLSLGNGLGAMDYIMPPMPPPIPGFIGGIGGRSSFFSATTHSVVRNMPAIEAAFSSAMRVT